MIKQEQENHFQNKHARFLVLAPKEGFLSEPADCSTLLTMSLNYPLRKFMQSVCVCVSVCECMHGYVWELSKLDQTKYHY